MDLLLKALGLLALAVFLLFGLAAAALWLFFQMKMRQVRRLARMMGGPVPPIRVTLVPLQGTVPPHLDRLARELEEAGFERAGAFEVAGMPAYIMIGLANPAEDVYAAVATHPMQPTGIDLVQMAPDGRSLTVTSGKTRVSKSKPAPKARPLRTIIRRPDADIATLLNEWRVARLTGEVDRASTEGFIRAFESEYQTDIEWEYREGRYATIDLEGLSKMTGTRTDSETEAFIRQVRYSRSDWQERLLTAFLKSPNITATKWEEMRDQAIFVHDGLTDAAIAELLLRIGGPALEDEFLPAEIDAAKIGEAGGATPRDRFRNAVTKLGQTARIELVATVERPEPFDVYRILE